MTDRSDTEYAALHKLGELEHLRGPDPYPHPTGPAPSLEELRRRRGEIERLAARHGASVVRVFGSVARRDARPDSDLDLLVEMGAQRGLLEQAALQGDLQELLGCRVHVVRSSGSRDISDTVRERIEREALEL